MASLFDALFLCRSVVIAKDLFFSKDVPPKKIITFLRNLFISPYCLKFDTKQIVDFLENTQDSILEKWDVVLIEGDRNKMSKQIELNNDMKITPSARGFWLDEDRIRINGKSGRISSPTDAINGLTAEQINQAKENAYNAGDWVNSSTIKQEIWFKHVPDRNPLLMIYFIRLKEEKLTEKELTFIKELNGLPVMGFSVGFPMIKSSYTAEYHKYKVNLIYTRQEIEANFEESLEE